MVVVVPWLVPVLNIWSDTTLVVPSCGLRGLTTALHICRAQMMRGNTGNEHPIDIGLQRRTIVDNEGRRRQLLAFQQWRQGMPLRQREYVTAVAHQVERRCYGPWRPSFGAWFRLVREVLQVAAVYTMGQWYPRGMLAPAALAWARRNFNFERRSRPRARGGSCHRSAH